MRRAGLVFGFYIILSVLLALPVAANQETENLVSVILEDFNDPEESAWIVRGSKFITEGFPRTAYPEAWPAALHGANREGFPYRVLGVNGKFDRLGYNYIEFIPDRRNEDGEFVGIPIPGRCKLLDLWVWGSNHNYYLEAHLTDYRGITHVLPLGDLNFAGWRNLKTEIPPYIPQGRTHIPQLRPLSLVKLVMWTRPTEKVDNFFVYLDQIKVLTDMFVSRFDGDELADPELVDEIWSTEGGL